MKEKNNRGNQIKRISSAKREPPTPYFADFGRVTPRSVGYFYNQNPRLTSPLHFHCPHLFCPSSAFQQVDIRIDILQLQPTAQTQCRVRKHPIHNRSQFQQERNQEITKTRSPHLSALTKTLLHSVENLIDIIETFHQKIPGDSLRITQSNLNGRITEIDTFENVPKLCRNIITKSPE